MGLTFCKWNEIVWMVRAKKNRINKYKSEYITKLVGVYIRQKWYLTVDSICTKMGNINGAKCRMNYINVNHLVRLYDAITSVSTYGPTRHLYHIVTSLTSSPYRPQYTDVYIDDINCITKSDATQQHHISELVLLALKDIYPWVPGETKESVGIKKALVGDRDWAQVKEILGWIVDTRESTLRLPSKRIADLHGQLDIPPTQRKYAARI